MAASISICAAARRDGAGQAGQIAGLGQAHIVQCQCAGRGLGIREGAERVQAGRAEGLGEAAACGQRRRGGHGGRAPGREVAEREGVGGEDLGGVQAAEKCRQAAWRNGGGFEQAGGDVEPGRAGLLGGGGEGQQQVGAGAVEQGVLGQGAGGDEAHDVAADRRLADAQLGVLHLLGDGDAKAAADQAREVEVRRATGTPHIGIGAPPCSPRWVSAMSSAEAAAWASSKNISKKSPMRKNSRASGCARLQREPLRHGGRGAGGGAGWGGVGHGASIGGGVGLCTRPLAIK